MILLVVCLTLWLWCCGGRTCAYLCDLDCDYAGGLIDLVVVVLWWSV